MSELSDSIAEAFRKRAVSATFGTYFFFWAAYHWQALYATFFTSQDIIFAKYRLLKNEYVNQYFFEWHGWSTILGYLLPFVLTIIFIWPMPKYFLLHAYRQEQRNKVDRRRIRLVEEQKIEVKKESLALQTKKTLQAEIDTSKTELQAKKQDPKILWQKEYDSFSKSGLINNLPSIADSVYIHGGRVARYYDKELGRWVGTDLTKDAIAIAHTNDLIEIMNDRITLTEKGKFFLGQSYFDTLPS